jgi:hypothetical protein
MRFSNWGCLARLPDKKSNERMQYVIPKSKAMRTTSSMNVIESPVMAATALEAAISNDGGNSPD